MGYVSRDDHALLDFRLSLPEEWARDEQRRQECHVPLEVRYQTRQAQCLEMLDEWGEQVPHGWVTGDDELGSQTGFGQALRERGGQTPGADADRAQTPWTRGVAGGHPSAPDG